jgi:tetratricopeptide (TPR) repeat protein
MKLRLCKAIFLAILIVLLNFHFVGAWDLFNSEKKEQDAKALRAIVALNYCHASLQKIIDYNDRVILDEQYNEIINNINLTKIDDEEVINILEELIHTLNKFKINEKDKEKFERNYEKKLERAFYKAFSNPGPMFVGDPISASVSALVSIGSSYANYKQMQEQYREELDDALWEIEKDEMTILTSLRADFLHTYWEIMKRRNIPDKKRLTEKQLSNYIEVLKDGVKDRRYRKLERIQNDYFAYPPFWYYYGNTANGLKKTKKALSFYETFVDIHQGFFREDVIYSSVLMNKIQLLDKKKDKKEILNCLEEMNNNSPNDARKRLFAALKYFQYKEWDKATFLLQANIDDNKLVKLSRGFLGQVYVAQKDTKIWKRS